MKQGDRDANPWNTAVMLDAPVDIAKGLPDDAKLLRCYNTRVMRLLDDLAKDVGTKHGMGRGDPQLSSPGRQSRPRLADEDTPLL
jgi:hypothetical protein